MRFVSLRFVYVGLLYIDPNVDIHELDIPVNAVATALKDFVSKRLPPLFEEEVMSELEDIAGEFTYIIIYQNFFCSEDNNFFRSDCFFFIKRQYTFFNH